VTRAYTRRINGRRRHVRGYRTPHPARAVRMPGSWRDGSTGQSKFLGSSAAAAGGIGIVGGILTFGAGPVLLAGGALLGGSVAYQNREKIKWWAHRMKQRYKRWKKLQRKVKKLVRW